MPRGDGTGPAGMGPMTGRRAGFCTGFETPGFANPAAGYGAGRGHGRGGGGRGRGWGWRHGYHATGQPGWTRGRWWAGASTSAPSREDEQGFLEERTRALQEELEQIRKRLEELSPESS